MRRWLAAVLLLLAGRVPLTVTAQPADAPVLSGTVRDQTAAPVPGADVVVVDAAGRKEVAVTDGQGGFAFLHLANGTYTLTVAMDGFATLQRQVRVPTRREEPLQLVLRVGLSLSLDVLPAGPAPPRRRPQATTILTGRDIESLPENFLDALKQMAGATLPGDVSVRVNGSSTYRRLPRKNAIEMIRIDANPFSAEFQQPGRKQVEITTKPGSDSLHGGAKVVLRGTALNAKNPLASTNPSMRHVDPDGFVSGPIRKDQADFEIFVQQARHEENAIVSATTLDPVTQLPRPFGATVGTPLRTTMSVLNTDVKLFGQLFSGTFANTRSTLRRQGLGSGLDLEESAHDLSSQEGGGELGWTRIGRRAINTARVHASRVVSTAGPLTAAPGVVVLDAFNGGGSAVNHRNTTIGVQASENLTFRAGRHTMQIGAQFDYASLDNIDRTGFNGTFTFGAGVERDALGAPLVDSFGETTPIAPIENYRRTLLGLPGYGPSQFSIVAGEPRVGVRQSALAWYFLDNWTLSKQLWLAVGMRGEMQQHVSRQMNLAPRVSLSWHLDADGVNAIEAYSGVFYSRVEPGIRFDATRLNGVLQQERVVQNPSFFPVVPTLGSAATLVPAAQHTVSPDVRMPHDIVGQVSYERRLPHGVLAVAALNMERGRHLLRSRNTAVAGAAAPVFQVESTGRSWQRDVTLSLWGAFSKRASMWGAYTHSRKESDTDSPYTMPADSQSQAGEYGRAADNRRHRFEFGARFEGPRGFSMSPALSIQSGTPFNITTGRDTNGDTLFTDRPAFAVAGAPGALQTPYGWLNPHPRPGDVIIPRNFGTEPWQVVANLSVTQPLVRHVTLTANAQNLFNATNLLGLNGVLTSSRFGAARRALDGRGVILTLSFLY